MLSRLWHLNEDVKWFESLLTIEGSSQNRDVMSYKNLAGETEFEVQSIFVKDFALNNIFLNLLLRTETIVYEPSTYLKSNGRRSIENTIKPIVLDLDVHTNCKKL